MVCQYIRSESQHAHMYAQSENPAMLLTLFLQVSHVGGESPVFVSDKP